MSQELLNELMSKNVDFILIDENIGKLAAQIRAMYNLSLTDALQIATAIESNCEAFLTNDLKLKRVKELSIIVISELTL